MDDLRVIMEVQRHRILYDTANPFYKDNYRKEQAWSEISAALGADPNDCKARWRILRDSYVKYLKKNAVSNGPQGGAHRDWKYTNTMAFILPFVQNRAPKRPFRSFPEPDCDRSGPSSSLDSSPCPGLPAAPAAPSPASPVPLWTVPLEEDRPSSTDSDRDEMYHFAMSTVPLLLRLGKRQRRRAKLEILQTLDRLEEEEEVQAAARKHLYTPAAESGRMEAAGAGAQRPPAGAQRPLTGQNTPAGVYRPPAGVQTPPAAVRRPPGAKQDDGDVKVEMEDELGVVCVKSEESNQTERPEEMQAEETQLREDPDQTKDRDQTEDQELLSEAEGQSERSSDTDDDADWEPL